MTARDAARADSAALDALLARLAADGDEGVAYEALRRRLIRFFDVYVPAEADALADVVLDRVARKIHEGTEVASVLSYTLGVARMVLHEARARAARRRVAEVDPTLLPGEDDGSAREIEVALGALSACLDAAGGEARGLILEYYGADGASRIALRQRLAAERGISLNALRNRALRLREALEDCVRKRLGPPEPP
jgi:DNA-directed RNA polymerase specialized sigma24 family protein